jgi:hypothetical protein
MRFQPRYTPVSLPIFSLFFSCSFFFSTTGSHPSQASDPTPAGWDEAIDFTETLALSPNLQGSLRGQIAFIQNTLVGPQRGEMIRPLLVTDRSALLAFFPVEPSSERYRAIITQTDGTSDQIELLPPWKGPKNDSGNSDGRPDVVYSKVAWYGVIPWQWMHRGLEITITDSSGKTGKLPANEIEFGAPIELVTQHVEIGMLLPPSEIQPNLWSNPNQFRAPELAIDYFQMVPIARFTAAQYLPIHFPKIVLPNGKVYTERSDFEGAGVYKGDMRQEIAKGMVSTGINYANIGIPSSIGGTEKQPRPFRQTTVHTSAGIYTETDDSGNRKPVTVRHGLSGGGGQLTLLTTIGNEFSHEYGHDHGLPHYPGGEELSAHSRTGSWGYNLFKNRFIGNLAWNGKAPEQGDFPYRFGHDAMAGGKPMGTVSEFTLYTPFSLNMIQEKVSAESGVLDESSSTGYRKWDAEKQAMTVFEPGTPKPDRVGVPVMTLLGMYDPVQPSDNESFIYPALYGNWGNVFSPETIQDSDDALTQSRCSLVVTDEQGRVYRFPLHDERLDASKMNQFHVNLPASVRFIDAKIIFGSEEGTVLHARKIDPPHGKLPPPVIVGRDNGFTDASLRLATMDEFLIQGGYSDPIRLRHELEDYYGEVIDHEPGTRFETGKVYRRTDGTFYQAMVTNDKGEGIEFRKLGETKQFLSRQRLQLGETSKDYAKEVMNGTSGVYYYVPVDRISVVKSDSVSPEDAAWYASGEFSSVTVIGELPNGEKQPIVLRGQINDRHVINRGAPVTESSRIRFSFFPEDNPSLPPGNYKIAFSAYAQAWHAKRMIESFQVVGVVKVRR